MTPKLQDIRAYFFKTVKITKNILFLQKGLEKTFRIYYNIEVFDLKMNFLTFKNAKTNQRMEK